MWINSLMIIGMAVSSTLIAPRAFSPDEQDGVAAITAAAAPAGVSFSLAPKNSGDKVLITYSASSAQVSFRRMRLMANGNPDPDTEHKWTKPNTGSFLDDPEPPAWASPAKFQYQMKPTNSGLPWSQPKTIANIH